MNSKQAVSKLCLECGLCCSGVLFRDVELQPGDQVEVISKLKTSASGRLRTSAANSNKLPQPCAALCDDLRCKVYSARPARCREFECALLQAVTSGEVLLETAMARIGRARTKVRAVEHLLEKLGDQRVDLPLKKRFQSVQRRLEKNGCDAAAADAFGKLTESYHSLGLLLASDFYV